MFNNLKLRLFLCLANYYIRRAVTQYELNDVRRILCNAEVLAVRRAFSESLAGREAAAAEAIQRATEAIQRAIILAERVTDSARIFSSNFMGKEI